MIKYFILILIIFINYTESIGCNQDYECGNTPYTLCKKNHTIAFHRLDIDKENNRVFFTINYSDENEKRIVSIPLNGSNGFDVNSHATIYGQDTYQILNGLSQVIDSESFVIYGGRRIIGTQNYIFYNNNTIGLAMASVSDSNYIFDSINNIQYVCHPYSNRIYKGPIKSNQIDQIFYYGCSEMKSVNNILYILYYNKIYLGSLNPSSLEVSTLTLPIVFTPSTNEIINSFEVSSTHIYYLTGDYNSKKIYKVSLNNQLDKVLLYSGGDILSFKYYNNYIYFIYNNKIQRVSTISSSIDIIFESSKLNHCICAQGFNHPSNSNQPKCSKCDWSNNIQSWVNGIPRCIPLDWRSPNNPTICNYDWQCKYGYTCKEKVFSSGTFSCLNY